LIRFSGADVVGELGHVSWVLGRFILAIFIRQSILI
jgi:hypothetical protein